MFELERPFQNWTRVSADILGTLYLHLDHTAPVEVIRLELRRVTRRAAFIAMVAMLAAGASASERSGASGAIVSTAEPIQRRPVEVEPAQRGLRVRLPGIKDSPMTLFFWEWNLFDAIEPGDSSPAEHHQRSHTSESERLIVEVPDVGVKLTATGVADGADLVLEVHNTSERDWPELASLVPCLHIGHPAKRTRLFDTQRTSFLGPNPNYS